RLLRRRAMGDDACARGAGRGAARDLGDLRRTYRRAVPRGRIHAPAAGRHRRGDVRPDCAEDLDRLQLAVHHSDTVPGVPGRLALALHHLRAAVVEPHGDLPVLGRARLLLDLLAEQYTGACAEHGHHLAGVAAADLVADDAAGDAARDRSDRARLALLL